MGGGYPRLSRKIGTSVLEALGSSGEYYGVGADGRLILPGRMKVEACTPQAWTAGAALYFMDLQRS